MKTLNQTINCLYIACTCAFVNSQSRNINAVNSRHMKHVYIYTFNETKITAKVTVLFLTTLIGNLAYTVCYSCVICELCRLFSVRFLLSCKPCEFTKQLEN